MAETPKHKADPLIYIVIFFVLTLIFLALLTWVVDLYNLDFQCQADPNIWCFDTWTCQNSCTGPTGAPVGPSGQPVSPCYQNIGPTGLASCLYGPNSSGATACYFVPDVVEPQTPACECIAPVDNLLVNCLSQCALDLSSINKDTTCCCQEGKQNCPPGVNRGACGGTN